MAKEERYSTVVLGLGGMGSAALYHLSRRSESVCGVEQFDVAHDRGSSHGELRIIRKAYFEHPDYVPLLHRAYALWEELEKESGERLLVANGLLLSGKPGSPGILGLKACYSEHDLPHDRLSAAEAQERFSSFRFPEGHEVFYDPLGGFLRVERCTMQHLRLAERAGATIRLHETVDSWRSDGDEVVVNTDKRRIVADKIVVTVGAWAAAPFAELGVKLDVVRKVQLWYRPSDPERYAPDVFPCFYCETDYGDYYGFPVVGDYGVKVAEHSGGTVCANPKQVDRGLQREDESGPMRFLNEVFPDTRFELAHFSPCMYTKSPDEHFIIDIHSNEPNVVLAAGFSGHGYKFASVVGEILADLALRGETEHPIEFLGLSRFRRDGATDGG